MPVIRILPHAEYCPEGATLQAPRGTSVCEALLDNGIEIEEGFDSLGEPDEAEEDLLDRAWGLTPTSRLSCQAILSDRDVTIEIPKYSINHAREKH
jgi:2Fe-2S ferredoxin